MKWEICFFWCWLAMVLASAGEAQTSTPKPVSRSNDQVIVPAPAAALVRPILDEKQKGVEHNESRLSKLLYDLTQKQGHAADEALVVLMCFDVGESQEEIDAVIARGKKMLPLLKRYQGRSPEIPGRNYPDSMFKGASNKADTFEGAIKAINHGWHSTADNPEG